MNVVENFTASTHFELEYMPYTHSLLGSLIWSGAAYCLFRWVIVKKNSVAAVVALAVFSHWVFDLIVHTRDLPIWTDASPKLGFGLWNNAIATYSLEAALLVLGLWLYLRSTSAATRIGKYGAVAFVGFLLLVNIANIFGPPMSTNKAGLAIFAVTSYLLFAAIAFWLDTKRS